MDVYYERTGKDKLENYYVVLEQGFNDTVEIYLNTKLVEKKFYKTDGSLGVASGYFELKLNNDTNILFIKIKDRCIELLINKKYKIIYISFIEKNEWWITYSNREKIYE